jgi:osmotically-inducible protein OsmY
MYGLRPRQKFRRLNYRTCGAFPSTNPMEVHMVFKQGTFHGTDPEHFEAPHPAWLEAAVADALAASGDIDASDVTVTCVGTGIVLTGSVSTDAEGERAVAIAAAVKGVSSVENRLSAA